MIQTISPHATDAQSLDTVHALLGDGHRRAAVDVIAERDVPMALTDLAATIAGSDDGDRTSRDIAVALHHVHLPALDDAGVVDYDAATNTVTAAQPAVLRAFVREQDGGE